MLMVDNDVVKRVLTMRECIEAQERGALVYRHAKRQGLGRKLPTEWFLQDIKN
jgi:hypothetical protein